MSSLPVDAKSNSKDLKLQALALIKQIHDTYSKPIYIVKCDENTNNEQFQTIMKGFQGANTSPGITFVVLKESGFPLKSIEEITPSKAALEATQKLLDFLNKD
jgi:hypothetical protein